MDNFESRILRGVPEQPISNLPLPLYLFQRLKDGGDKTFAISADDESRRLSYAQLLDQSSRLAKALCNRGIGPGDIIAVCSENSIEFMVPVLATIFIGAACCPLSYTYTTHELQHLVRIISPKVIFFSTSARNALLETIKNVANKPELLVTMPDSEGKEVKENGSETLSEMLKSVNTITEHFKPYQSPDPSNCVALVLCSSGTTGLPKGVQLTQTNVFSNISNREHQQYQLFESSHYTLGHLPMFHGMGLIVPLSVISRNFTLLVMARFSLSTLLRLIQDYKVEVLAAAPPLIQQLAHNILVSQYDLSSLTYIYCGAAPLSAELQDAVIKKLKTTEIRQGYGLTENSLLTIAVKHGLNKLGSSGCLIPGMEAKIVDEFGRLMGPNERGELCFRGSHVMKGYINDPNATAQVIDKEGWLHTGDVGYYDEDECFFIVDRIKELIKYKGYQVAPAELEGILQSHPGVLDAAVVGLPNPESGELPLAFVVRKDPALTEKEIVDFVAMNVSPQKKLRGGVKFIETIPKSPSGKILRRELRRFLQRSKL